MKHARELYLKALAEVLSDFGITEQELFANNKEASVQGRIALVRSLSLYLSDSEIAACTPLRRCSVCQIRNRYDDKTAPWSVKKCIEVLNMQLRE